MIRRLLEHRRYMREHRWTHAHLSAYLDQDLSPLERERVEDHVGICPHCRRVLRTLRRTLKSLMELPVEPRPSVADGVLERLRREP
ncbi:MAG: zf-HC2 domain-containing protein [Thermoleophilaceae bacterium]|nr:zf-HC2 domain-containing protein [Thermoleophilaceae bacterium]